MKYKMGELVELVTEQNTDLKYGLEDIIGVTLEKQMIPTIANLTQTDLDDFIVVHPKDFVYNPRTHGKKIGLGFNTTNRCFISTWNNNTFRVKPEMAETILPEYLYLHFLRDQWDKEACFHAWGSSTVVLLWSSFCEMTINVPSIEEQRKIVRDYHIITKRIELLGKINDKLIEAGTHLFKSVLDNNRKQCREVPLYDIAGYINGTSFAEDEYAETGLPIIKIAELKDGITAATQYFIGEKDDKYFIVNGDVLFSWSGNPDTSIDAFIWTHGRGVLNQHTFKMVCFYGKAFTFFMLKYCKPEFIKAAQGKQTTGLGHVTVQDLKRLSIPFDAEIAKEFNDKGMPIYNTIYRNLREINLLSSLKNQLLVSISRTKDA